MIPMAPGFFRPQGSVLPPGGALGLWLDASDSSTITLSSTAVTGWRCKITNEDFVQGTSNYRPTIDTSTSIFPLNCIDFYNYGGASKWLGANTPVTLTIPFTIFMVAEWPYFGPPSDYWSLGIFSDKSPSAIVNGSRSAFCYGTPAISRSPQISSNSPTGYSYLNGNVGNASPQKAIVVFTVPTTSPSDVVIEYNEAGITETVFGTLGSTYGINAVGSPEATYKSMGVMAEVLGYTSALDSTNKQLVIDYLNAKWLP